MTNKFEEIINLRSELERKIKSFGKEAITEGFAPFFAANPQVQGIIWTQYTPYFNDGEACIFGVHVPCMILTPEAAKTLDSANLEHYRSYGHPLCFEKYELRKTAFDMEKIGFMSIWMQIPEEVFLSIFGDHVKVTLMRDGSVTIDDYDHE